MNDSYFNTVGSYMMPTDPNELARLNPVYQNIGMQQANQNAAMQQGNQLTQQAGQTGQQQGGMNPMAMAMALRKKKPEDPNMKGDDTYFGSNSNGMGAGGSADFNNMIGL